MAATVADCMSRRLVSVSAAATVGEAATVMARGRVGSVLVLEGERLAAIFTERDVVRAVSGDAGAASQPVEHWMTRAPRTIGPEADLEAARAVMLEGHFRHLPVLEDGRPVGMLSMRDIVNALGSG